MSDQTKKPNDGTPHQAEPGKRLDRKAEPALTPAQARKKKEKRIMIIMIVAAVIMVAAAAVVLLVMVLAIIARLMYIRRKDETHA